MKQFFEDTLFGQMTAITKASAYDAIAPEYSRLQAENAELKDKVATLEIMLRGEVARVKALREFINEVRPDNATVLEMAAPANDPDDLKQVNI